MEFFDRHDNPGGKNSVPTVFRSERAKKMSGKNFDLETAYFPHVFLAVSQSERAKKMMRKFRWNSLGITLLFYAENFSLFS